MSPEQNRVCFVVAPIGDPESETRRRSDQILKHVIVPVCESVGYKPVRADQISEPGIITTQIIQHIIDDAMVIADLSGKNPNVFYELAIRHVLRKPYVQIIQIGERIPFDVSAIRTIEVDHHDLDSVELARAEILRQIQSVEARGGAVDSPISVAVDLDVLRRSGKQEERQLGDLMAAVAELGSGIASVAKRLNEPANLFPSVYIRDLLARELRPLLFELRRPAISDSSLLEFAFSLDQIRQSLDTGGPDSLDRDKIKDALSVIIKRTGVVIQSVRSGHSDENDPKAIGEDSS